MVRATNQVLTYAVGVAPPRLTVVKSEPAEVLLQWPTNYPGFMVESTPSLDASILWQPMGNEVTVDGAAFSVRVSTSDAARLFRLHKP